MASQYFVPRVMVTLEIGTLFQAFGVIVVADPFASRVPGAPFLSAYTPMLIVRAAFWYRSMYTFACALEPDADAVKRKARTVPAASPSEVPSIFWSPTSVELDA